MDYFLKGLGFSSIVSQELDAIGLDVETLKCMTEDDFSIFNLNLSPIVIKQLVKRITEDELKNSNSETLRRAKSMPIPNSEVFNENLLTERSNRLASGDILLYDTPVYAPFASRVENTVFQSEHAYLIEPDSTWRLTHTSKLQQFEPMHKIVYSGTGGFYLVFHD